MKEVIILSNVYSIITSDRIELDITIKEIKDKYKDYSLDSLTIDGDESSLITILNEINTIPFLNDYRMVIVKRPLFLYDKTTGYDERLIKDFLSFIKKPLDSTILILVIDPKESSKLIEEVKSSSNLYDLSKNDIIDINTYVKNVFERDGYTISLDYVEEIVKRSNNDKGRIIEEIEKLKIYKADDKKISYEDIELLVSKDIDENVFDLVSLVLKKDKLKSLKVYHDLLFSGVSNLAIISAMVVSLVRLYKTKELVLEGLKKNDIAEILKISSGRAYYLINDTLSYNIKEIKRTIKEIVNLEYDYKSGKNQDSNLLLMYLTSL